jgi:hypothetical protein
MRFPWLFGLFLIACCVGCGDKDCAVSGKVTFKDGSPVPSGQVTLVSSMLNAGGPIASDGTYTITARVPAGTYQVAVRATGDQPATTSVDIAKKTLAKPLVDLKYGRVETSELTVEVKGNTTYNITVEPPK